MNAAIAKCREIGASKLVLNKGIYKVANDGEINFSDLKDFILTDPVPRSFTEKITEAILI